MGKNTETERKGNSREVENGTCASADARLDSSLMEKSLL